MVTINDIQQIRSATAYCSNGSKVGRVGDVYVDDLSNEPAWVTISAGLFGTKTLFAPLLAARLEGDRLLLAYDKDVISGAPPIADSGHISDVEQQALIDYFTAHPANQPSAPAPVYAAPVVDAAPVVVDAPAPAPLDPAVLGAGLAAASGLLVGAAPAIDAEPVAEAEPFAEAAPVETEPVAEAEPAVEGDVSAAEIEYSWGSAAAAHGFDPAPVADVTSDAVAPEPAAAPVDPWSAGAFDQAYAAERARVSQDEVSAQVAEVVAPVVEPAAEPAAWEAPAAVVAGGAAFGAVAVASDSWRKDDEVDAGAQDAAEPAIVDAVPQDAPADEVTLEQDSVEKAWGLQDTADAALVAQSVTEDAAWPAPVAEDAWHTEQPEAQDQPEASWFDEGGSQAEELADTGVESDESADGDGGDTIAEDAAAPDAEVAEGDAPVLQDAPSVEPVAVIPGAEVGQHEPVSGAAAAPAEGDTSAQVAHSGLFRMHPGHTRETVYRDSEGNILYSVVHRFEEIFGGDHS